MIELSLKLIIAHLIGDFLFQPTRWVEDKRSKKLRSPFLYWHMLVHAILLALFLQFEMDYAKGVLVVLSSHFAIDVIKLYLNGKIGRRLLFFSDQVLHLVVIGWVVYSYEPFKFPIDTFFEPPSLMLIASLLTVSIVSGIIMKVVMSQWVIDEDGKDDSLPGAGFNIGILERLLTFTFIVLNQWQAIGFLIAAKSVLRFSDLSRAKNRRLTEYILIGTLISFGLAITIGLGYLYLLKMYAATLP
ncbi:MAG: DUF3307 domain-containing protein [Cyclobacteriaceae bacterium]